MDRTFIILLVMFILTSAVIYDRYLISQGEVSPVSRLIDFVGLAKYDPAKKVQTAIKRRKFKAGVTEDLVRLRNTYQQIEAARVQLVSHRRDILAQLQDVNSRVQAEARKYVEIIQGERKRIEEELPDIRETLELIASQAYALSVALPFEEYQQKKKELVETLSSISRDPLQEFPAFNDIFALAEKYYESPSASLEGESCEPATPCFEIKMRAFEADIRTRLETLFDRGLKNLDGVFSVSGLLEREYEILAENLDEGEKVLVENNQEMEDGFQELVEMLDDIGEDDLLNLMKLYKELWDEYQEISEGLYMNFQRVYDCHRRLEVAMEKVMPPEIPRQAAIFEAFKGLNSETKLKRDKLEVELESTREEGMQLSTRFWLENKTLILYIAQNVDVDVQWEKLMDDRNFALRKKTEKDEYLFNGRDNGRQENPLENFSLKSIPVDEDSARKTKVFVDEQMQRIRDRVKDHGYFGR